MGEYVGYRVTEEIEGRRKFYTTLCVSVYTSWTKRENRGFCGNCTSIKWFHQILIERPFLFFRLGRCPFPAGRTCLEYIGQVLGCNIFFFLKLIHISFNLSSIALVQEIMFLFSLIKFKILDIL